jgi:arginyl-tRNA synthetase
MKETISSSVKQLFDIDTEVVLTRPDEKFGDFATNVALQIAKKLEKNPREIAEAIAGDLGNNEKFAEVSVAGPGFINIRLSDNALLELTKKEPAKSLAGNKILVEYSDPNPLKPLHAGHLYTTLVGDVISSLISEAGAEIIRLNYGGDVGLHTAKSMWSILREIKVENPDELTKIPEESRPEWLGARYVEGNLAYEEDEAAKNDIININKRIYKLHDDDDHDSPFAQIYWTVRQWSYDYFSELYRQLDVIPFDRFIPESEVTPLGIKTVKEQLTRGVYTESDDAVVFKGEQFGLHTRVFINSEGLPTYEAKDVGLSLTKWRDYEFDESIIITANEQDQYMQVVIKSIEQFAPEPARRTKHLKHGVVKLQGGVKMSSRKGNVVTALEILEAARQAGADSGLNPNEKTILAAVKYAFSKVRIGGDISYNPKESIALDGNSGPYIQYSHARARGILDKISGDFSPPNKIYDEDRSLVLKLSEYKEVVELATRQLEPHHICTYLFELAQVFNRYYEKNQVVGSEHEKHRAGIVATYADTLKSGLAILGIDAPERM